jgi:hypothetical protein
MVQATSAKRARSCGSFVFGIRPVSKVRCASLKFVMSVERTVSVAMRNTKGFCWPLQFAGRLQMAPSNPNTLVPRASPFCSKRLAHEPLTAVYVSPLTRDSLHHPFCVVAQRPLSRAFFLPPATRMLLATLRNPAVGR